MVVVVEVVEHERGWGQRLIDSIEFVSEEKAQAYINEINSHNTASEAPDTYIEAHIKGR